MNLKQIQRSRERIAKVNTVKRSPIMSAKTISEEVGNQIFLKCEHLQKTGSFKIRGAANKVIYEVGRGTRSVVAASSGNHGQAVAYIADKLGITSTIVVPDNVASCKREAIIAYNGKLEYCGTTSEERINKAEQICGDGRTIYIPPYDDPLIIAGQGTIGLEILEQLNNIDEIYVPIGGGGVISGVAIAIKETNPNVRVIGVEPKVANDTYLSLTAGERIKIKSAPTIADGLRTLVPGELTFSIIQRYTDEIVLVDEDMIKQTFILILKRMKQVIEASAAVPVAAALARKADNKRIVALVTGGNIDPSVISSIL